MLSCCPGVLNVAHSIAQSDSRPDRGSSTLSNNSTGTARDDGNGPRRFRHALDESPRFSWHNRHYARFWSRS